MGAVDILPYYLYYISDEQNKQFFLKQYGEIKRYKFKNEKYISIRSHRFSAYLSLTEEANRLNSLAISQSRQLPDIALGA